MTHRPLGGDEEALALLVERLGLTRAAARSYVALARGHGLTASDLAALTGLSRQDAAAGARELEARGLARADRIPSGGRPTLRYHRSAGAGEGLHELVAARRAALADEERQLRDLEARLVERAAP